MDADARGVTTPDPTPDFASGRRAACARSLSHSVAATLPPPAAVSGPLGDAGRRRKRYRITASGERALAEWLAKPTREFTVLRDPGLLQLFFGADPVRLAEAQLEVHRPRLAEYEESRDQFGSQLFRPIRLVLKSGIGHEREWIRSWKGVLAES